MANKLIRHYGRGHLHFITFTCYRRPSLLRSVRARNVFVKLLGGVRDRYGFSLVGYLVMPEHIHLPISEPVTLHKEREGCATRKFKPASTPGPLANMLGFGATKGC